MKKIINGRKYDTDTAKEIGCCSYSNSSDFDYVYEELYQKRTGEFFIYGEGGPRTRYAKQYDYNTTGYGKDIIPISINEAKMWAEENCSVETYEEIFGEVDE